MTNSSGECVRYPLLESLLIPKGLSFKGIYTIRDTAQIFGVSTRTIQEWVRDGKLVARELPGRGKFLSEDLEMFLHRSLRRPEPLGDEPAPSDIDARGRGRIAPRQPERRQHAK